MTWLVVLLDEAEDLVDFVGNDVSVFVLVVLHVPLFLAPWPGLVLHVLLSLFQGPRAGFLFFGGEWEKMIGLGFAIWVGVGLGLMWDRWRLGISREEFVDACLRDELILHDPRLRKASTTLRHQHNRLRSAVQLLEVPRIEATRSERHFRVRGQIFRGGWCDRHKGKVLHVGW